LANIALRLERKLRWDPDAQQFADDDDADEMLSRKQQEGYEIQLGWCHDTARAGSDANLGVSSAKLVPSASRCCQTLN
jgi:hypothetical protein